MCGLIILRIQLQISLASENDNNRSVISLAMENGLGLQY